MASDIKWYILLSMSNLCKWRLLLGVVYFVHALVYSYVAKCDIYIGGSFGIVK